MYSIKYTYSQIIIITSSIKHGTQQPDGYVISPRLNAIMDSPFGQPSIHPLLVRNTYFLVNFIPARFLKPYLISPQLKLSTVMHFPFPFLPFYRASLKVEGCLFTRSFLYRTASVQHFFSRIMWTGALVIYSFRCKRHAVRILSNHYNRFTTDGICDLGQ